MRAAAVHGDLHTVGSREDGTGATRHLAGGKRQDVLGEGHTDVTHDLRQSVVHHGLGAFTQFFGWLEQRDYGAAPARPCTR